MAWPLGRCRPPTLPAMGQNRQKLGIYCLLTPLRQLSQDGATMNESEKQFSLTRAALSAGGRAETKFLSLRGGEVGEHREAFEVQVRFNRGARIEATFPKRGEAIAFLRGLA